MAKCTPGPYRVVFGNSPDDFIVTEPTGNTVAETNLGLYSDPSEFDKRIRKISRGFDKRIRKISRGEAIANAHLFAAAPEMLEALKGLLADCAILRKTLNNGRTLPNTSWMDKAEAAIAKAEGVNRD